jgi:diadenosine tetraphosphate (Ap4A) HIT family hydrolase
MNKHILLVMKWLKNPESVSQEELEENAYAAYWAAAYAYADAADAAYAADAAAAAYWVDRYFQITGEDKQAYIDKLGE